MATFRDLLSAAKSEINEVDTDGAGAAIADGAFVLDVREPDEYGEGALKDAIHIPRGHLEAQIEGRILDKSAPIVAYCAGGFVRRSPPRRLPNSGTPTWSRWVAGTADGRTRGATGRSRSR